MLASQQSRFLARSQAILSQLQPANIKIGNQSYQVGTSGIKRAWREDGSGGGASVKSISFSLRKADFETAGQPVPVSGQDLACTAPASFAASYHLENVSLDPTATTVILRCIQLPQ